MTTVTQYYNINAQTVPFLDVNVHQDNLLFVDPFAIRLGLGPSNFAADANRCTATFFDEVTRCVVSGRSADHRRGERLLQRFEEPRETRLGMSAFGFNGHGGADGVGSDIWTAMNGSVELLVEVGILKHLEELPLFVPGVGNDITSDLTTRVIFRPLADFTGEMVRLFPQFAVKNPIKSFTRQVWDPLALAWKFESIDLPTVNGEPLVLVPREWVRHELSLNAARFYDTTLLSHVQMERAVVTSEGKVLKTPKDRLREDPRLARGYNTIVQVVEDAYGKHHRNIVGDFKRWVRDRYVPTTDEQVLKRTA